jgi:hypothetical protein
VIKEERTMQTDRQGNRLPGATADAAELFDQAVHAFNIYRGDPVALLDQAIETAPGFAMAKLTKAHLMGLATEPEATAAAKVIMAEVKTMRLAEREASHAAALDHLLAGDWTRAALAVDRHTMRWPRDLVALQCGHLMDFYRANARDLRDRIARALPHWSASVPGHSIVQGMYAFGLEESGDYARAETMGIEATEAEPLDCWAHHAVAHVLEMQGRPADGLAWMRSREPHWDGDDNFFKVHNWWHQALCHLELGEPTAALALYDARIRQGESTMALDLVDASALLWRLQLSGLDVGERWQPIAAAWDAHADGRLYPFNDWHAAMAFLGAGRIHDVQRILDTYRGTSGEGSEASRWARTTGRPLIEGFAAFWHGRYAEAAELLHDARYIANSFGGSHAQRDIIDWTMTEAAIRGGMADRAQAFAAERLALRPHSPVNKRFIERTKPRSLAA